MERSEIFDMLGVLELAGMRAAEDEIVSVGVKRRRRRQSRQGRLCAFRAGASRASATIAAAPTALPAMRATDLLAAFYASLSPNTLEAYRRDLLADFATCICAADVETAARRLLNGTHGDANAGRHRLGRPARVSDGQRQAREDAADAAGSDAGHCRRLDFYSGWLAGTAVHEPRHHRQRPERSSPVLPGTLDDHHRTRPRRGHRGPTARSPAQREHHRPRQDQGRPALSTAFQPTRRFANPGEYDDNRTISEGGWQTWWLGKLSSADGLSHRRADVEGAPFGRPGRMQARCL